ncbi:MAG: HAMP domain-containing histidine kinase [Planctomycetes bacterium]|nr:HAMP domain-containing histidine kinase [Planctomycetota bacterium]MCP4771372.1 HAMP domain-containing histidine kinase [Planctomycetota bacterium]MCP4861809.1 HAMP domain-containing histidine kinase [Planctomycetota bacterium]
MTNPPYSSSSNQADGDSLDAAMAAHDLRHLLSTVVGHAGMQLTAFKGDSGSISHKRLLQSLEAILVSAAHATTLCEEMLEIANGQPAKLLPVDLAPAAAEAAEIFRARAAGAVEVRVEGPQHLQIRGNRVDLQRAMLNLMWNALEAMAGEQDATLTLRWGEHDDGAWLEVVDSGPGLPDQHMADLTRPFHSNNGGDVKVRGLGLHSVARMMRGLGGRLLGYNRKDGGGAILRLEFGLERELDFGAALSAEPAEAVHDSSAGAADEEPEKMDERSVG